MKQTADRKALGREDGFGGLGEQEQGPGKVSERRDLPEAPLSVTGAKRRCAPQDDVRSRMKFVLSSSL